MKLNIYINWNDDKESIQLPINPESFEVEGSQNNTSVVIQNFGEVNLKGKRNLYGLSFESFFPAQQYDFARCSAREPYFYIEKLKKLLQNNTTLHCVITETDVNMQCTIESFTYGEEERNGDVKYSLTLKEDRESKIVDTTANKTVNKTVKKAVTKRKSKSIQKKYKWKKGDTWHKVSKKTTGTSANYKAIKAKNKAVIRKAKKKHPKKKEKDAMVGYTVVIQVGYIASK